jgi:hypothetical protein
MSRSHRSTPVAGYCADSDKPAKVFAHRALRAAERQALARDPEGAMPLPRETSDVWNMPKDGKGRIDQLRSPERMRK